MEKKNKKKGFAFSKKLIEDIRALLWIVTLGGLVLAFYCVKVDYEGALPWISAMVGLPWAAHGAICSCYLNMAKSDHKRGGITYLQAEQSYAQDEATI